MSLYTRRASSFVSSFNRLNKTFYIINQRHGNNSVVPNREDIFSQAESADSAAPGEVRRTITMYRSGFSVDNGPHRRLSDPSNAEFLTALARGMVPRELREETEGEVMVGLVDKRSEEYDPEKHGESSATGGGEAAFQSFSGEGQSLGATTLQSSDDGVIDPVDMTSPPPVDSDQPSTSIAVRLPNGKRVVVKLNTSQPVSAIGQHIGNQVEGRYVLTSGFPPRTIENLGQSVEEAGLKGAQVGVKKV